MSVKRENQETKTPKVDVKHYENLPMQNTIFSSVKKLKISLKMVFKGVHISRTCFHDEHDGPRSMK